MRSRIMMLALVLLLGGMVASASETSAVTIPFSFESHGELFPASRYEVRLGDDRHHFTITSRDVPAKTIFLPVVPADIGPHAPSLSMRFNVVGGSHLLQSVRLGSYQYKR